MKIAFVVPGFSADENDWCIPAHTDIIKTLAQTNEVHVFTLRYPHRVDTYKIGNATVHSFNGVGSRGGASARLWRDTVQRIARENKQGAFDVIHAIFGSEAGCVAVLAGRFLRVPSVVWMVNGEMVGLRDIGYGADLIMRQRWMNNLILNLADRILCGCDALTAAAHKRNARAHVETLPLGVNSQRFCPAPQTTFSESERAHFVNVGSLLPVKDQETLLRAFKIVLQRLPKAHLTIAGVGPLDKELQTLAAGLGIAERVNFAGQVSHDQLAALYRNADVFVQASRHEGQGMALLEAAACGCAVCGTNVGALADLAKRGGAVTCQPNDAAALAETMLQTFQDRALLAARVQRLVSREYDLEQIRERLLQVYHHPAQSRMPSSRPLADA